MELLRGGGGHGAGRPGRPRTAPVFIDGKKAATLRGPTLTTDFKQMVVDYIDRRFGQGWPQHRRIDHSGASPAFRQAALSSSRSSSRSIRRRDSSVSLPSRRSW